MRDIGYSTEAAIADLIDNSITAKARNIWVDFQEDHDGPYIAISDDGVGMGSDALLDAMRPGSRDPRVARDPQDLGRFGLGLKTASFSQCRLMSVVARQNGHSLGMQWDLDLVAVKGEWVALELEESDIGQLPNPGRIGESGVMVLWRSLDRLMEETEESNVMEVLNSKMDVVLHHLELVFHRYLAGEQGLRRIDIHINGHPLRPRDPFGRAYPATTQMPTELMTVEQSQVAITPYILPHHSKISAKEYEELGGKEGHLRNQGFYVYRNRRLIVHATWFRLARHTEATKLARVLVDLPNTLDHLWTLDVKKSSATPPESVQRRLRNIIERITGQSKRVYQFRGRRSLGDRGVHVWDRVNERDRISYRINRAHPLVSEMASNADNDRQGLVEDVLQLVEEALPVETLFSDLAERENGVRQSAGDATHFRRLVCAMVNALRSSGIADHELVERLVDIEPFNMNKDVTLGILAELGIRE